MDIKVSHKSPIQLLFKSDWSEFFTNGQLSNEHTHNSFFKEAKFILSIHIEQSLFSTEIIPTKFFIPSPSISSSQISGILSQSMSHLYCQSVQFLIAFSHKSEEFIWTVHWFTNATHLFTSTELVNNLSHAFG